MLLEYQQHLLFYYIFHNLYYKYFEYPKKYYSNGIEQCKLVNAYSLSNFNYTLCGLILLFFPLKSNYYQNFYPYFLCIQGPLSYVSNSVYIDTLHWSHKYDNTFSKYNTIIALYQTKYYHISYFQYYVIAVLILLQQLDAFYLRKRVFEMYIILHNMWISIIPLLTIYTIYKDKTQLLIGY